MRNLIALLVIAPCCFAEAPYPPSGTKPKGAVFLLPTEYGPPRANQPEKPRGDIAPDNYDNLEDFNAKLMERLRQEQDSERGVYHVYLQDGRLQRVQYTTAPIRPGQQDFSSARYNNQYQQQQQQKEAYLASIQYTHIEPIQGPVYSYKPQPLTRILRYAPGFY